MAIGWQQIVVVGVAILILFGGKGKISALMGDLGRGIRTFRLGLESDEKHELPINGEDK